jgi:hypothetical protein
MRNKASDEIRTVVYIWICNSFVIQIGHANDHSAQVYPLNPPARDGPLLSELSNHDIIHTIRPLALANQMDVSRTALDVLSEPCPIIPYVTPPPLE